MTVRPILFSGPMVVALLEGRKTQTRRLVKGTVVDDAAGVPAAVRIKGDEHVRLPCPYGEPGDRLWVRETWRPMSWDRLAPTRGEEIEYAADRAVDDDTDGPRWRPSIFLPRWASRLTLEIRSVRVERLHAITEDDARAEGIDGQAAIPARINGKRGSVHCFGPDATRKAFALLWDGINGKRAPWASNPWVWCIGFSVATNRAREAVDG